MIHPVMRYAAVDDHGDAAASGEIVFDDIELAAVIDWAEENNYLSASIIMVDSNNNRFFISGLTAEDQSNEEEED